MTIKRMRYVTRNRDYEPNDREEIRALNLMIHFDEKMNDIQRRLHDPPWPNCHALEFALDGTRCNGNQKPSTVLNAYQTFIVYTKQLRRHSKEARGAEVEMNAIFKKVKEIMRPFKICRACKGKQGTGESGLSTWVDCQSCGGAGMVSK